MTAEAWVPLPPAEVVDVERDSDYWDEDEPVDA